MVARTKVAAAWYYSSCVYQREEKRRQASLWCPRRAVALPPIYYSTTTTLPAAAAGQGQGPRGGVEYGDPGQTRVDTYTGRVPDPVRSAAGTPSLRRSPRAPRPTPHAVLATVPPGSVIGRSSTANHHATRTYQSRAGPCIALHLLLARQLITESRRICQSGVFSWCHQVECNEMVLYLYPSLCLVGLIE
jgi:hypothetical protein